MSCGAGAGGERGAARAGQPGVCWARGALRPPVTRAHSGVRCRQLRAPAVRRAVFQKAEQLTGQHVGCGATPLMRFRRPAGSRSTRSWRAARQRPASRRERARPCLRSREVAVSAPAHLPTAPTRASAAAASSRRP